VVIDRAAFGMTWNPMRMAKPIVKVSTHLAFRHDADSTIK
jgi:hypothetical protein